MTLYHSLGLENWRASTEEVRLAWRKVALENHPDKVVEKDKEAATMKMQQLNAARDMLSDRKRRCRYHVDGKLPWAA
ncbi:DnaJ domain-containing protein [Pyrenochaeta sp. MPI-SDFR-AT-0127]|nr:DnaJ domain-containing protein [Pyrenochaeta sp. MPI-SDFR-AT-0127]